MTNKTYDELNTNNRKLFLDQKDFFAEFIFNPDIQEDSDFRHLDKNLAITRLSSRYAEPERARAILTALHTLSNKKYFKQILVDELAGYEEETIYLQECPSCEVTLRNKEELKKCPSCKKRLSEPTEIISKTPVFQKKKIYKSLYPKTYHKLKSSFYSLTTTAAARDGHLIRAATTTHFQREESIEDKT